MTPVGRGPRHRSLGFDLASTTLENDFNVYVEYLFIHHADLIKLAARDPLIRKKFEMVQAFYGKLGVKF